MKISKFILGLGVVALMSACSNDEPVSAPGNEGEKPAGSQTMLQVNIKSADSRAEGDEYAYGDADEHEVLNATFFFFDENGIYAGKGEKWTGGTDGTTPNVEYLGKNVIVLDDQESNTYPKYVMTILNAPANFSAKSTLAETSQQLMNWQSTVGAKKAFMMSTSSFYGVPSAAEAKHYDDTYYYVTVLDSSDFIKYNPEKGETPVVNDNTPVIDIYVERLAAKIEVTFSDKGNNYVETVDGTMIYKTDVTIMGEVNNGESEGSVATTPLYIRVYGWDLSGTVADSYLSKQLEQEWNTTPVWANWNKPADYRSFWAKSTVYGNEAPALTFKDWNNLSLAPGAYAYCNENTNLIENVTKTIETTGNNGETITELAADGSKLTSVMLKAELVVKNDDGQYEPVKGIRYNGAIFTDARYKDYILNIIANSADGLNIWKGVYEEGETEPVKYEQIGNESVQFKLVSQVLADADLNTIFSAADYAALAGTGKVVLISDLAEGTYFARGDQKTDEDGLVFDEDGNPVYEYIAIADPATALNTLLAKYQKSRKAESFEGGMFYTIPIEHEITAAANGTQQTGYYGVVRNHWYKVTINNIVRIGHGVFDPGSDTNPGEPIIPDEPENPRYYVAANINILSWKLVNQNVDL